MICFEITRSPDADSVGEYSFQLDRVTFGDTKNSFLTIYDHYFRASFAEFKIIKNSLYLIFKDRDFLVNQKKFRGTKRLSFEDTVQIGETFIYIKSFKQDFDLSLNLSEKISNLKQGFYEKNPKRAELILQIEDEIINHEHK